MLLVGVLLCFCIFLLSKVNLQKKREILSPIAELLQTGPSL